VFHGYRHPCRHRPFLSAARSAHQQVSLWKTDASHQAHLLADCKWLSLDISSRQKKSMKSSPTLALARKAPVTRPRKDWLVRILFPCKTVKCSLYCGARRGHRRFRTALYHTTINQETLRIASTHSLPPSPDLMSLPSVSILANTPSITFLTNPPR
jgi:hypothetical protein